MHPINAAENDELIRQRIGNYADYYNRMSPEKIAHSLLNYPLHGGPATWQWAAYHFGKTHDVLSHATETSQEAITNLMGHWQSKAGSMMADMFMNFITWLAETAETASAVKNYAQTLITAHEDACRNIILPEEIDRNRREYDALIKTNDACGSNTITI